MTRSSFEEREGRKGIGERIARVIAPEAVTLTTQHVNRLREEIRRLKKLTEFQAREIKRLRKVVKGQ